MNSRILFLLPLIVLFFSSISVGQTLHERYYDNIKNVQKKRLDDLQKKNQRNEMARQWRQANKRFNNARVIQEESGLIFGDERIWTEGIYEMTGVLSSVKNGRVVILGRSKAKMINPDYYASAKLTKLSEEDQEYVDKFREFDKLSKKAKEQYVKDHYAKIAMEKLAKLREASMAFRQLVEGFEKIEIDNHTYDDALQILGSQVEVVSDKEKTKYGTTESHAWWAMAPESNRRVALQVDFKDGKISRIRTKNWDKASLRNLGSIPKRKGLFGTN